MRDPLLENEENAISLSAKNTYYLIQSVYNSIKPKPDLDKVVAYTLKRKELMEKNSEWASMAMGSYLSIIHNLQVGYIGAFKIKEFDAMTEAFRQMPERFGNSITPKEQNLRLAYINDAFLVRCFYTGEFEKGVAAIKGREAEWEEVQARISNEAVQTFYDNVRTLYFAVGDYKKAISWNNKILNNSVRFPEIYLNSLVMNIIIHYDIGNYELVGSLVKSALRLFGKEKKSHLVEKLYLVCIQKNIKADHDEKEVKIAFSVFRKELVALKSKGGTDPLDYFSSMAWVDSHLYKKKYVDVFKKHLKRRK
jgi:tetratricopeptide (TPR) repeat protein